MRRLIMAGVIVALTSTQSHACPLLSRLFGKSCKGETTYTYAPPTKEVKVVPASYTAPVSSCPNGSCANQALQVGPSRGSFRLFK